VFVHTDAVEVKRVKGKGRGVFARRFIAEGEVIERVPVLVFPVEESDDDSVLSEYCFLWGRGTLALALGYGSLYNHSYCPNARYDDVGRQTKVFTALRDIEPGEEVTVNYNGDPNDRSPVEFDVIESASSAGAPVSANGEHRG
jgi:SET domain-containing protein